jgi:predicted small secreted protein
MLKLVLAVAMAMSLTACGTLGGAVSGAGEDLTRAGNWIKNR